MVIWCQESGLQSKTINLTMNEWSSLQMAAVFFICFSLHMVLCWTTGDVFKTIYFLVRSAPVQFWLCGMLQVSLDILILLQVFYYSGTSPRVLKEAVQWQRKSTEPLSNVNANWLSVTTKKIQKAVSPLPCV